VRSLAAALLLFSAPRAAEALPFLHLFLQGEVDTLGRGGAEAFRDLDAETRRLERPALLADGEDVAITLFLDNELTLALRAGPWAGTRADDQRLGLTAAIPIGSPLAGVPVTLIAGIRRESGFTRLQSQKEGVLFSLEELREWAIVGFSTRLPYGLSLGGALEQSGAGPRWLAEVRYQPVDEGTLWLRHQQVGAGYRFRIPDGAAKKVFSPALSYPIELERRDVEVGGAYRLEQVWAQGGILTAAPFDFWVEVGTRPLDWVALRLGADRELDRYDDRILASGLGSIASVDLDVQNQRYFGGIDLLLGARDDLTLRYVYSRLESLSRATEIGTNAAQAFLHVDYDFGLLFRSGHRIEASQLAIGWSRRTLADVDFSVGAQYFRLSLPPGAYELTSDALSQALAAEAIDPTVAHLMGVTGSVDFPIGAFRLGAAMGQLLPLALDAPGSPAPSSSGSGSKTSSASWIDRLAKGLRNYGGGNRLMFQLTTRF